MPQYLPYQTTARKNGRAGSSGANSVLVRFTMAFIGFCSLYVLLTPQHGLIELILLDRRTDELDSELAEMKAQNNEIRQEIMRIQTDKQYLEEIARKKYGLLKDNEIIYEVTP